MGQWFPVVGCRVLPSPWPDELEPEVMVMWWRRWWGSGCGGVAGGASRRFSASLWIGLGLEVGNSGGDEPRTLCPWSPPPLYSTARQGPTSLAWAGRPRSGRGSRAQWAVGPIGGEINLTFSPLISSYTFNFILWNNSFQSTRSITDLHVEHVSSSRSIPIESTPTTHSSVLKQIL